MRHNNAQWVVPTIDPYRDVKATTLAAALKLPPMVGHMLMNRGVDTPEGAELFLRPGLKLIAPPETLNNAMKAGARIAAAIKAGQRIVVYGDYDVDGVTGTTTMFHALKYFGADVLTYLPHRMHEGYGISGPTAEKIILGLRPGLIVTVDCGVTGVEAAEVCKKYGIEMIVTDHHEWEDTLPDCYTIVHPRLGGQTPNPDMCGAAVAWKVAWAIGLAMSSGDKVEPGFAKLLRDLLCFTALGTIADVVPLKDENRVICVNGLGHLPNQNRFAGLTAFLESAGLAKEVDGYAVGFRLAPRINAAGRMDHAEEALRMFTRCNYSEAMDIAVELEKKNKERQQVERDATLEAIQMVNGDESGIVVVGEHWHGGVVGIVASRVVEQFNRPALVLHKGKGDMIGGSGRSVPGFNVRDALKSCADLLEKFGGHAAACGLKIRAENLEAFKARFNGYCETHLRIEAPRVMIDCVAKLEDITVPVVLAVKMLGPFGHSNRKPLLLVKKAMIIQPKTLGKEGKHLSFVATQGPEQRRCVAWGEGELAHKYDWDRPSDIVVEPEINEFNGRRTVQLLVRDIRPSAT